MGLPSLTSLRFVRFLGIFIVSIGLLSSSVLASSKRGHVDFGFSLGDPYPQTQYNTDRLYSIIARSIAKLPLRKENYAPVALWSMGKVGYQTKVSIGSLIPYSVLSVSHVNKLTVNDVNLYTVKSRNFYVPVYQDEKLLGWVYIRVSGSHSNPNFYPSHIGHLNLAHQWEQVNAVWGPKGANPHLVLDERNHVAYFTIPTLKYGNLTPVFDSQLSKPIKTKALFKDYIKQQSQKR